MASPNRQYRPPSAAGKQSTQQTAQKKSGCGCGWPVVLIILVVLSSLLRSCDNQDNSMSVDGTVRTTSVTAAQSKLATADPLGVLDATTGTHSGPEAR